ncbi:hypothetical protein KGD82_03295 [Nocardiopsis eucommiae]|uniref:Uncharacterized protein n=1 Tax=Nocardiopsis eucommiae TaxID=2831970 RepID=A0A975LAJ1_9ACTN|nr:hypothetical protein KGD82_03295 [Nocardiopsis eucommiae]
MKRAGPEEQEVLELLRENADDVPPNSTLNFPGVVDDVASLWVDNQRHDRAWSPDFVKEAARLLRKDGNRHGFSAYYGMCQTYALRISGEGFPNACYYRSKIQIIIDDFVPFADLVHPADSDALETVDTIFVRKADDIVPIPSKDIPWWVPESHWWWRVPTRDDWTEDEINAKINDYYDDDWDS